MRNNDFRSESLPDAAKTSLARRRDVIRKIGLGSVAAGASTPMAALATGYGRKHCFNKTKGQPVQATLSGMNSVMLSAQAGEEVGGYPCTHYGNPANVPASCKKTTGSKRCLKFSEIYACSPTDVDSHGKSPGQADCYFDMKIDDLCKVTDANCDEKHWVTAYCNASADNPDKLLKYPYTCFEIVGFRGDFEKRPIATQFFKYCMENKIA